MSLSDKELAFCKRFLSTVPLSALASKLKVNLLELSSELRKNGVLEEIYPHEIQFIKDSLEKMPASEIQTRLSLSASQFSQILQHKLGAQRRKATEDITLEEAISKTKWLIEERLKLDVDDFLPREISGDAFFKADLYACIKFAAQEKEKDSHFSSFPSVAYLVCKAYPGVFEPFQFKHSKDMSYFLGKSGRKNILNAITWVLEKKMNVNLADIKILATNKYFLRTRDLSFYGISPHYYRKYFPQKADLIDALVLHVSGTTYSKNTMNSVKKSLAEAGHSIETCEIEGCSYKGHAVDLHHIFPKAKIRRIGIDPNVPANLIPLCPNHHRVAHTFNWKALRKENIQEWRNELISFILEKENV